MTYNVALAHFPKITYARYKKLTAYFSNLSDLWEAELADLVQAGMEENIANEFLIWRDNVSIEKIMERLETEKISAISIGEPAYPKILAEIPDPPHTIFVRGQLPDHILPHLGVVGTRRCTNYGKLMCERLSQELAMRGVVIVSGLAMGIDGIAHSSAMEIKGTTIAVLGSGVSKECVYPASHRNLADNIVNSGGAILSEYPPDFTATCYSFPARNRIIAGLSLATLVIEAPESSGALITAKHALDYNRDVMAVPHPITSLLGVGCNNLIKMGAKLISSAQDVIEALNLQYTVQSKPAQISPNLNPNETKIMAALTDEPKHIDAIIKDSCLDSSTVNSTLVLMEMRGTVKNMGGMNYTKN